MGRLLKAALFSLAAFVLTLGQAGAGSAQCEGGPRVIFLGDSLTAGGPWARLLPEPWIKNAGVPGDTTYDILDRLDPVLRARPDMIFIMAGINDLWAGVSPERIVHNHGEILRRLADETPDTRVFLQSLIPVNPDLAGDRVENRDIRALNRALEERAAASGVTFIDLYADYAGPDGELRPEFTSDGIHLVYAAYHVWQAKIAPLMAGENGAVPGAIRLDGGKDAE